MSERLINCSGRHGCGQTKPASEFYFHNGKLGRRICRDCDRIRQRNRDWKRRGYPRLLKRLAKRPLPDAKPHVPTPRITGPLTPVCEPVSYNKEYIPWRFNYVSWRGSGVPDMEQWK